MKSNISNQQILKKSIQKALKNGWKPNEGIAQTDNISVTELVDWLTHEEKSGWGIYQNYL